MRRKWRSHEPMQGDKHENHMKIEYSARLVVSAHEMALSGGDRGAITGSKLDRQRCGCFISEIRKCWLVIYSP